MEQPLQGRQLVYLLYTLELPGIPVLRESHFARGLLTPFGFLVLEFDFPLDDHLDGLLSRHRLWRGTDEGDRLRHYFYLPERTREHLGRLSPAPA